jgi:hypothetical protein
MLSGIHGFAKRPLSADEVFRIVDACAREYGELRFELFDGNTMKTKKTKRYDRARELVSANALSSITALSAKSERNSVEVELRGDPSCYLPYDVHVIRETSENDIPDTCRFFDSIVVLSKSDYAFGLFADDYMEITQELRFVPMRYWSPASLDETDEHREYLFALQHMRPDIGRRIPQMYPINYFSPAILPVFERTFRRLIDDRDWEFIEVGGITRAWFRDISNTVRFKVIQEEIRKEKEKGEQGQLT